jgi:uncharacterized membrane protein
METIRNYLDNVFAGAPDTEDIRRLKAEMLANMEERYLERKAAGKSEHEAVGEVIASFGNVEELFAEMGLNRQRTAPEPEEAQFPLFLQADVDAYLKRVWRSSLGISIGVGLIIAAVGIFVYGWSSAAQTVSTLSFFLLLLPSIGVIVFSGMRLSLYDFIDRGAFRLAPAVRPTLEAAFAAKHTGISIQIVVGIILCIGSVAAVVLVDMLPGDVNSTLGVFILLLLVALAVPQFILAGMRQEAYKKLLQVGEYAPSKQLESKVVGVVASIVWPLTVVAFLIWGFGFDGWATAWILFPIVGILFGAFSGAAGILSGSKKPGKG